MRSFLCCTILLISVATYAQDADSLMVQQPMQPETSFDDKLPILPFLPVPIIEIPEPVSTVYNMPVYDPEGQFSMKVMIPDSTQNYTLKIAVPK